MAITPTSLGLTFDLTRAESVQKSQRWVLVAMQQFGPALVTTLWRILGSEEDVCDAYQDTFLRLVHLPDDSKPTNTRLTPSMNESVARLAGYPNETGTPVSQKGQPATNRMKTPNPIAQYASFLSLLSAPFDALRTPPSACLQNNATMTSPYVTSVMAP